MEQENNFFDNIVNEKEAPAPEAGVGAAPEPHKKQKSFLEAMAMDLDLMGLAIAEKISDANAWAIKLHAKKSGRHIDGKKYEMTEKDKELNGKFVTAYLKTLNAETVAKLIIGYSFATSFVAPWENYLSENQKGKKPASPAPEAAPAPAAKPEKKSKFSLKVNKKVEPKPVQESEGKALNLNELQNKIKELDK